MLLLTYLLVEYVPLVFEGLGAPLSCNRGAKCFFLHSRETIPGVGRPGCKAMPITQRCIQLHVLYLCCFVSEVMVIKATKTSDLSLCLYDAINSLPAC